ncbi:hypothetical protein ACSFCW_22925 [Yokenella regensburgei]|uniref:hypothetical protein n=1 Tax=Yokenella regensburgei TaxID=158877 RepID=UPI003EDB05D6
MKKLGIVILLSFFISGCSAWEQSRAKTIEQKRDYLLKSGPQYVPSYLLHQTGVPQPPMSVNAVRNQLVAEGGETKEFIQGLVDKCFNSADKYCTVETYFEEKEKIERIKSKDTAKKTQFSVKKGDLFYCRVTIHQEGGPVDTTGMRVRVKDNVDSVGFLFPNGQQIISPKLDVVDSSSGERYGRATDGSVTVRASYDGHAYAIQLFDNMLVGQFNGAVVTHTSKLAFSGYIDVWGCEKVR